MAGVNSIMISEIEEKYLNGKYSMSELARIYRINKGRISKLLRDRAIKGGYLDKLEARSYYNSYALANKKHGITTDRTPHPTFTLGDLATANETANPAFEETINIIKEKNPKLAKSLYALSELVIMRCATLMENENLSANDLNLVSKIIENLNNSFSIFPKTPLIAQQFNINGSNNKKTKEPINLNIEFVEDKKPL